MTSSLWGCSGNGVWILVRLPDWPNDDEHRKKIARFNRVLRLCFQGFDGAKVDAATVNPSRVMALVGSWKCKGSHTQERPWRMVTFDGRGDQL